MKVTKAEWCGRCLATWIDTAFNEILNISDVHSMVAAKNELEKVISVFNEDTVFDFN